MRYAKPALLVCALAMGATFFSGSGKAVAPPATQPAKVSSNKLRDSVEQKVQPVASNRMVIEEGKPPTQSTDKVIVLNLPTDYMAWLNSESDMKPLDGLRIELQPFPDTVLVSLSGAPTKVHASVENVLLGKLVDWGYHVQILQTTNYGESHQECMVEGVIRVDERPDHRYEFPFKAIIELGDKQPGYDVRDPARATVTWQKPECWKKDEK